MVGRGNDKLAKRYRKQSTLTPAVRRHTPLKAQKAALIAWLPVVRVDDLVKDGAKRRRLRRSLILDKIINANKTLSMRSRPPSRSVANAPTAPPGQTRATAPLKTPRGALPRRCRGVASCRVRWLG